MRCTFEKKKNKSITGSAQPAQAERKQATLPNSLVMRILEDSQAEKEADQLSKGVTSGTPDEVMREMGSRLGADFSDVQFHSDSLSMNRSKAMGARAWAQGKDVYFGKGGFDPKIAAHELVHAVQQGAVRGDTTQSAPYGAVQLFRGEDENDIYRRQASANADTLQLMTEQKNQEAFGPQVFSDLVKPTKKLAEKSGSRIRGMNDNNSIAFLANLSERDYSGKEIIRDIATRTVINKDEMYDRIDEYEGFIDYMGKRTNRAGLQTAAVQSGVLDGNQIENPDNNADYNKRAYEMTEEELAADTFNPKHDPEVAKIIKKIDKARNVKEAYHAFLGYTENKEYTQQEIADSGQVINFTQQPIPIMKNDQGDPTEVDPIVAGRQKKINDRIEKKLTAAKNKMKEAKAKGSKAVKDSPEWNTARQEFEDAKTEFNAAQEEKKQKAKQIDFRYKQGATVNLPMLKAKLKNMVRQVKDYPELKNTIGALNIQWNQTLGAYREEQQQSYMSVITNAGASEKAMINYDAFFDRNSPEAEQVREEANNELAESIGNLDKAGNHELGHILESTLNTTEEDQHKGVASNDILQSVLPKVMTQDEQNQVRYNAQDGLNSHEKPIYQGQIDTTSPIFTTKQMSSSYGQSMPKEWFAEAFHDVYTKGAQAKPTSIEIVKEYERRQIAKQKSNFQKKEKGWFTNFKRKISKWFNFGTRRGAQQLAPLQEPQQPNIPQMPVAPAAAALQQNAAVNPGRQVQLDADNDFDMIVEAPRRKNLKKKKKKKK